VSRLQRREVAHTALSRVEESSCHVDEADGIQAVVDKIRAGVEIPNLEVDVVQLSFEGGSRSLGADAACHSSSCSASD
jgi:hypothetical protein